MEEDAEEEPEEEVSDDEEGHLVGAQRNDMTRIQKADVIRWMKNHPEQKDNAAMVFDRDLMREQNGPMSTMSATMSTRLYDAVVNNNVAWRRNWHPLERWGNQTLGWYPWGTLKKHMMDPRVWGDDLTDKTMWMAITHTKNHQGNYYSFMIKVIRKEWVFIKATPRGGIGNSAAGSASGGPDDEDNGGGGYGTGDGEGHGDKGDGKGKGDGKDGYGGQDGKPAPWHKGASKGGKGTGMRASAWAAEYYAGMKKTQEEKDKENAGMTTKEKTKPTETRQGTFAGQLDARAYPSGSAPKDWFVGQMTPHTYANGEVDSWREVKFGEKCQWSDRIARCTKLEHQMRQN
jgi:hypothetical protein